MLESKWISINDGIVGSEGGIIVRDEEYYEKARITIEKDTNIAPYSITIGIYGLMFHTNFFSSIEAAEKTSTFYKVKIEEILKLSNLEENEKQENWHDDLNRLLMELANS